MSDDKPTATSKPSAEAQNGFSAKDRFKAKNISSKILNLQSGAIQPGTEGVATWAEITSHPKHLEKTGDKPIVDKEK